MERTNVKRLSHHFVTPEVQGQAVICKDCHSSLSSHGALYTSVTLTLLPLGVGAAMFLPLEFWRPGDHRSDLMWLLDLVLRASWGCSFLGPSTTSSRGSQPPEDYLAEVPADGKHQSVSHESNQWILHPPEPSWLMVLGAEMSPSLLGQARLHEQNDCCRQPLSPGLCWFFTRKQTTRRVS